MIHDVISAVDMGTPILVREIPFVNGEDDDVEVFEEKVHRVEWDAVIDGVQMAMEQVKDEKEKIGNTG